MEPNNGNRLKDFNKSYVLKEMGKRALCMIYLHNKCDQGTKELKY